MPADQMGPSLFVTEDESAAPGLKELHDGLKKAVKERDALRSRIHQLLLQVGDPQLCKGCQRKVFFVKHKPTGKTGVYDDDGVSHFATCSKREEFR